MNILAAKPTIDKTEPNTPEPEGCMLGRELGDCPLKRAGCGSLYDALLYITPPWSIREYVRATMGNDAAARQWLAHLDAVTPRPRQDRWR